MGGQVVLTTGANSGIGLATAIELARRGFDSVGSVRSAAKGRAVTRAAAEAGVRVRTVTLDVTDPEAGARMVHQLKPYALVNNAGYSAAGAIEDVSDEEARRVLETMVLAPMRLARLALTTMLSLGAGRIVNISSIYGRTTTPLTGWYQGSKHALEALSDALRMEVAGSGVKVILVQPGGFNTGIWDQTSSEFGKHAGSRFAGAYRRAETGFRLSRPLMGAPETVARVIAGAIESKRPRARYLVGFDAQALAFWDSVLPTEIKDRLKRLPLGL